MNLRLGIVRALVLVTISILVVMPSLNVQAAPPCVSSQSPFWQICGPVESVAGTNQGINQSPSAVQAKDGTIRLAWTHIVVGGLNNGASMIYYSSRATNGTWQCNCSITTQGGNNQNPSIIQASNGTIFVFWSYKATTSNHYQIYYRYLKGTVWSSYRPVPLKTSTTLNDTTPTTAVAKDGTLWLVWARYNITASRTTTQLWYETLNSTGWSVNEQSITSSTDLHWNYQPAVMVGKDGTVRVAYANGNSTSGVFQINYIYRTGTGWSHPAPISNSNPSADDASPSMIQDRNGTIWIFWTRDMTTNFAIREIYSIDNGTSWRGETQLTSSCSGCADSKDVAAIQSSDKTLWGFFSTNLACPTCGTGFNIWALQSGAIAPIHNVDINSVTCSICTQQYSGGLASIGQSANLTITVSVGDPGDFNEPITVSLTATNKTNYSIGSQSVTVNAGSSLLFVFFWNTTSVKAARYGLSAVLSPVAGESIGNQVDNSLSVAGQVHILPLGDVDQDGSVTIIDVTVFFYDYNSVRGVSGSRYNPYCDLINTGIINIVDIGIALANYNTFS